MTSRIHLLLASGLLALGGWTLGCSAAERAPVDADFVHERNQRARRHGAQSMVAQQAALDALDLPGEAVSAPPGVDPRLWSLTFEAGHEATAERVALGRTLYFDTRLSSDGSVSCATCHDVTRGFADRRPHSLGIGGRMGPRNAPTTMNSALAGEMFWDGRSPNLEHQAGLPILNPIEMGTQTEAEVVERLAAIPEYARAFRAVFGRELEYADIGRAIGAFERTLIFMDSPYDRFQAGEANALSEPARRGLELYQGKGGCFTCHPLDAEHPLGTDHAYRNLGAGARTGELERLAKKALLALEADDSESALDRLALSQDLSALGRFLVTRESVDVGAFKTPGLRNVGVTFPYFHDGSAWTLRDVLDFHADGGEANPWQTSGLEVISVSEAEREDLVEFLFALTDLRLADQNEYSRARQAGS